jgi:hypothetical protein
MTTKRLAWMAALVAACVLAVRAQGLVVCGACGHEAKTGATVCGHCKAALPKTEADATRAEAPPVAPEANVDGMVERDAAGVVEACVRQARELEPKQPQTALCYYQNALALTRLVPSGTYPASVGEAILRGTAQAMQALLRAPVPCKWCGGTGHYQLDMSKVDRNKGVKAVEGMPCTTCKGAGTQPGFREVSKIKTLIVQGRAEFERRQMLAGDVRVGRALVPAALEKRLTTRQRALVMTGMPAPCGECQLSGRQTCASCRGAGWKKCDYGGCERGVLKEVKTAAGERKISRLNQELVNKCPKCRGLGEIACAVCQGSGGVACGKCDGGGTAPRCARCSETGLMACRRCNGTGAAKGAPCQECKGESVVLCSACRGEGAVVR